MMSIGELLAQINDELLHSIGGPNPDPTYVENLYVAIRVIKTLLEKNGETEEAHLASLDSKG